MLTTIYLSAFQADWIIMGFNDIFLRQTYQQGSSTYGISNRGDSQ